MENLAKIINQVIKHIYVDGLVTYIAITLGLRNQISHLNPFCGYNLLDIEHCLSRGLVRRDEPNTFKILVLYEPVHHPKPWED